MITLSYDNILTGLALFTAACVAGGWLIKIIKALKKPNTDIHEKLDRDNKRIHRLEDDLEYIKKTQTQLLQVCIVILDELKKNNDADGVIQKTESDMQSFLINNR